MINIDQLKTKAKQYRDAAQAHRNNALANDGAAQAIEALIVEMEACPPPEPATPENPQA